MPSLKNMRHEQFARMLVEGQKYAWTAGSAYARSGYRAGGHAAEVSASRLLKNVENGIAARVRELTGAGARRAEVTVQSLLDELEDARSGATSAEQFAAATSAVVAKAKLAGHWTDRVEVGPAGAFSPCTSLEEIADQVLRDLDAPEALALLDELRTAVEQRAASQATIVQTPPPAARAGLEAERALEYLRPRKF